MDRSRRAPLSGAVALLALTILSGCTSTQSSDPGRPGGSAPGTAAPSGTAASVFRGRAPAEITAPPAEGDGLVLPQPAAPLPAGYTQEELFVGGTATSFAAVDTPDDGSWTITPADEADYRTRIIVRRPPPEAFSGTVVIEWFNVSAIEAAPDWAFLSEEIGREGHVYIGVSAQAQGVEGGDTILDVDIESRTAADAGVSTDTSGLRNIDPARYGTLRHPGDAYAFDIFSQVGRAVLTSPDRVLGGLRPKQVLAVGESQSAIFLTTVANAVHRLDPVFDGYLIHGRASAVAPVSGDFIGATADQDPTEAMRRGVRIRTDLDVPVFVLEAETDLTLLAFAHARQPDTDRLRVWEVAGSAHADGHTIRSIIGGPRDPDVGSLLGCTEPINVGPQHEVAQAALHHLVAWAAGGAPPPTATPIELVPGDEIVIERDRDGNALGGVRNPMVDVPVATLTGDPPAGTSIADLAGGAGDLCILFGRTIAFDQATLVERYGTADEYVARFRASADEAVDAGFLLRPDADELIAEAEQNRSLFPPA